MLQTKVPYFSIERDLQIINNGGFFCRACLIGKSPAEQSPDFRYCQGCYNLLLEEAQMLTGTTRPRWIPRRQESGENLIPGSGDGYVIMSTVKDENFTVDIMHSPVTYRTAKRGPRHRRLPEDLIASLADEGMGSKAIASTLKADHGISVSYKTVQRVLSGERQQPEQAALPIL